MIIQTCPCKKVIRRNLPRTFKNPTKLVSHFFTGAIEKQITILEVGSGCLRNAFFVQRLGLDTSVLDLKETIDKYKSIYEVFKKNHGQVYETFPDRKFDVIICCHTLETICPPSERGAFLEDLRSHLVQDGYLLLSVRGFQDVKTAKKQNTKCPAPGDGYLTVLYTFIKPFTLKELRDYLTVHNLSIQSVLRGNGDRAKIIEVIVKHSETKVCKTSG